MICSNCGNEWYEGIKTPDGRMLCILCFEEEKLNEEKKETPHIAEKTVTLKLTFEDGEYEGETLDGKRHGYGVLLGTDGRRWECRWKNDKKQGFGTLYRSDGTLWYQGMCDETKSFYELFISGEASGCLGSFYDENGKLLYRGIECESIFHGWGTLYYPNGAIMYAGSWHMGKFHGNGTLFDKDGSVKYQGVFTNGEQTPTNNHFETLTNEFGIYEGEVSEGKKHGFGTFTFFEGHKYVGEWKDDRYNGFGILYYANGNVWYIGEWENGESHGLGIFYYSNGRRYEGEWVRNELHGQGALFSADNILYYEGGFEHCLRHGYGTCYEKDGSIYHRGFFENEHPV